MSQNNLPEPWLRGALPGVNPFVAPLLYSFQQAREDLAKFTEGLTPEQLWARPYGLNPAGREIRHVGGSVNRLMTYVEGKQLSDIQMRELSSEFDSGASREDLLRELDRRLSQAEAVIRAIDPNSLAEPRAVGRKQLPATVIGLIIHIAEHTQRHVGQAISAAKLARAMGEGVAMLSA